MALYTLLGLLFGSFLNVCIDRIPAGESIISPRSHCSDCGEPLSALDLIPVMSYLLLRGRCRYCGAHIPVRVLLVEITAALAFTGLWWLYGPTVQLVAMSIIFLMFASVFVIDLERHIIPNRIIYPSLVVAPPLSLAVGNSIPDLVIGGLVGFGLFFLMYMLTGKGAGDAKLGAFVGIISGWPGALAALFVAIVTGGIVAIVMLLMGKTSLKGYMVFGPFLVIGGATALFFGQPVMQWYIGLL